MATLQSTAITGSLVVTSSKVGVGDSILNIAGLSGSLFSVDGNLSGSLFNVTKQSGLPVFEAFSNDAVHIGRYGIEAIKVLSGGTDVILGSGSVVFVSSSGVVGINTLSPQATLHVAGNVSASNFLGIASLSVSSSYSLTASFVENAGSSLSTGSYYPITSSWSDYALSASYAPGSPSVSASYADTSSYALSASYAPGSPSVSASYADTSSYALSASYAPSSSFVSASYADTSSYALSASYAPSSPSVSASYADTSSYSGYAKNKVLVYSMSFENPLNTDCSLADQFRVVITSSFTLANPTNATDGQRIVYEFIQNAVGNNSMSLDSKFATGSEIQNIVLSSIPNKRDFLTILYNLPEDKHYIVALVRGY